MTSDIHSMVQGHALFRIGTLGHEFAPGLRVTQFLPVVGPSDVSAVDVIAIVRERAGFEALEPEWNALFERAGRSEQMFQTFNWLWHWSNYFCAEEAADLAIVTVRRAGMLIAIVPLVVERTLGLRQLSFMGAPVSQYGDALIDPVSDMQEVLIAALEFAMATTRADVVRLAKVRGDAVMAPVVAALAAVTTGSEDAPFADLAAARTQAKYDERFSSKTKKNRRRLERRLAERGAIGLDWQLSGRPAADAALTTMVLKRAWLKAHGQLSRAFSDRRTDRFFSAVCANTQRPAGARVSLLTTGGEIANAAITITVGGRQAVHILAYGMKFVKCAPGVLHVEKLIERAFADGVGTVDFLSPRHDYKLEWADGSIRVADYALPVSRLGKAYTHVYLAHVREALKAILKARPKNSAGLLAWARTVIKPPQRQTPPTPH